MTGGRDEKDGDAGAVGQRPRPREISEVKSVYIAYFPPPKLSPMCVERRSRSGDPIVHHHRRRAVYYY